MNRAEFLKGLTEELSCLPTEERLAAVKYYEEYFEEAGILHEGDILAELGSPKEVAKAILRDYSSVPSIVNGTHTNADKGASAGKNAQSKATEYSDAEYRSSETSGEGGGSRPREESNWRFWENKGIPTWLIVVICICAAPIFFAVVSGVLGLAGGAVGLAMGVAVTIIAMLAAAFILMCSIALMGICLVIGGIISLIAGVAGFIINPAGAILTMGVGLLLCGMGLLVTAFGCWVAAKVVPGVIRGFVDTVRGIINRLFRRGGKRA